MKQWTVLFRKEMLELTRSFKWLWIPLVFLLQGIMQPVSSYYMPQIIDEMGNLPEGAVVELPPPTAAQVLVEMLGQFGSIGILVLVLAFMGTVSNERNSGTSVLVLVKPVSTTAYLLAKWCAYASVMTAALFLGCLAGWYYTGVLIEWIPAWQLFVSCGLYWLWLLFIGTLTLAFSSIWRSQAFTAFLALSIPILLSILEQALSKWMLWSPSHLTRQASYVIENAKTSADLGWTLLFTMIWIAGLLFAAARVLTSQEQGE